MATAAKHPSNCTALHSLTQIRRLRALQHGTAALQQSSPWEQLCADNRKRSICNADAHICAIVCQADELSCLDVEVQLGTVLAMRTCISPEALLYR